MFTNLQKQSNTLKSSLLFKKNTNFTGERILSIKNVNFLGFGSRLALELGLEGQFP